MLGNADRANAKRNDIPTSIQPWVPEPQSTRSLQPQQAEHQEQEDEPLIKAEKMTWLVAIIVGITGSFSSAADISNLIDMSEESQSVFSKFFVMFFILSGFFMGVGTCFGFIAYLTKYFELLPAQAKFNLYISEQNQKFFQKSSFIMQAFSGGIGLSMFVWKITSYFFGEHKTAEIAVKFSMSVFGFLLGVPQAAIFYGKSFPLAKFAAFGYAAPDACNQAGVFLNKILEAGLSIYGKIGTSVLLLVYIAGLAYANAKMYIYMSKEKDGHHEVNTDNQRLLSKWGVCHLVTCGLLSVMQAVGLCIYLDETLSILGIKEETWRVFLIAAPGFTVFLVRLFRYFATSDVFRPLQIMASETPNEGTPLLLNQLV